MRAIGLLLAGGLLGAALAVVLVRAGDKLDAGVSLTYRCDQLALEFDARQSAEAIIEQLLVGESEARLAEVVDGVPARGVAGGGPRALVRAEQVSRAAQQAG